MWSSIYKITLFWVIPRILNLEESNSELLKSINIIWLVKLKILIKVSEKYRYNIILHNC